MATKSARIFLLLFVLLVFPMIALAQAAGVPPDAAGVVSVIDLVAGMVKQHNYAQIIVVLAPFFTAGWRRLAGHLSWAHTTAGAIGITAGTAFCNALLSVATAGPLTKASVGNAVLIGIVTAATAAVGLWNPSTGAGSTVNAANAVRAKNEAMLSAETASPVPKL